MKSSPKVSVIIPIYRVQKYLTRCLNSVLGQTYTNFEVICVNDGSTDRCNEILEDFVKQDKRIRVITQKNLGLSMARNNGLKQAKGDYIFFLDSDDCIHPDLLQVIVSYAQQYEADLVTFGYVTLKDKYPQDVSENEPGYEPIATPKKIKHKFTHDPLKYCKGSGAFKIYYNVWTKLYKRELLEGIKFIPNIYFEDYPYMVEVLLKNPKTVILNHPLYYYTENPTSISNSPITVKHIQDYHKGLSAVYELFLNKDLKDLKFLRQEIVPKILKHQLNRIENSPIEMQPALNEAFRKELIFLNKKGLISFWTNKLTRYLKYMKLIKRNAR